MKAGAVDIVNAMPETQAGKPARRWAALRWWFLVGGFAVAMAGGFAAWSTICYGSIANGIAYLGGRTLLLDRTVIDLGVVSPGSHHVAKLIVRNLDASTVQLIGSRSSCTCTVLSGLPQPLSAMGTLNLEVRIHVKKADSAVDETVDIFTDHPSIRFLHARIVAAVSSGRAD